MIEKELDNDIYYDLFISHKQINGGPLAKIIKLELEKINKKLNIFLDVDDLNNIHNLENNIINSSNILLLISEGVFERLFVQLELRTALKYNKGIIVIWDKDRCPNFPDKNKVPEDLSSILDIKAIIWNSEKIFKDVIIDEINKCINKNNFNKFLYLIHKKNNCIEIIEDNYIKKYVKEKFKYDLLEIDFNEILKDYELEIKRKVIMKKYSINIIILAILLGVNEKDEINIIQNRKSKINIYIKDYNKEYDIIIFKIKKEKGKYILRIILGIEKIKDEINMKKYKQMLNNIEKYILDKCENILREYI